MLKLILLTILCVSLIKTSQNQNINSQDKLISEQEFSQFTKQHRKFYFNQEEYNNRRQIYSKTLAAIDSHNSNPNQTSKMAVNRFSDLTSDQIHRIYTGIDQDQLLMRKVASNKNYASFNSQDTPDQVDWTKKGAVTSVKNQGKCGSCWAFSAAGSLQGAYFIKKGELKNFSEQQLVDCTYKSYKNYGCAGGMVDNSFDYFEDYQFENYQDYPYEGVDDTCRDDWSKGVGYLSNYHYVKEMSKDDLMAAIAKQPVSVHIQADQKVFSSYSSGIITSSDCGRNLDHAVLAVGYNKAENYFLIKNSWGADWGENGFVRIGMDNVCGVLEMSLFPEI